MQLPIIKTYKPSLLKNDFQFYVLSKGANSGRPSHTPNVNSFVVTCASSEELERWYSVCFVLWKGKRFQSQLCGSVVVFLRMREFKTVLKATMNQLEGRQDELERTAKALRAIEATEKAVMLQLMEISHVKRAIASRLLQPRDAGQGQEE